MTRQTPYFTGKKKDKIRLSGGDQVLIMLKSWFGSWDKWVKWEKNLEKVHGYNKSEEIQQGLRLKEFEHKNHVKFRYNEESKVFWICTKGFKHSKEDRTL